MTMAEIEIFKTGTHRDMAGVERTFDGAQLAASAAAYDPAIHDAPACVGHPKLDGPAYGWTKGLRYADGKLLADLHEVDPEFAELVRAKRYKHVSAAFYAPDSPANPVPGTLYLRHIGFLGATPPAIKGLKPVEFGADDAGVLQFADWDQLSIASIFSGLRDYLIEKEGLDKADQLIPAWTLQSLQLSAAQPDPDKDGDVDPSPAFTEPPELVAARAAIEKEKAKLAAAQAAFAESQRAGQRAADKAAVDALIAKGKILPAHQQNLLTFMESLSSDALTFGEGQAQPPRAFLLELLGAKAAELTFGEIASSRDSQPAAAAYRPPHGYAVDPDRAALHAQALAYAEDKSVSYIEALKAVEEK